MSEIVRHLVTIQRVAALDPIEGADRIEVASILGWKVVVQKGLYQVGDLVVFFEIDSFLPIKPEYEFLRKSSYRVTKDLGEGFRVKTVKLRGQISQGLLMPLHEVMFDTYPNEGDDVTEFLGVRKWEPNASVLLSGNAVGLFPHFIPKTDEPRWQNLSREKDAWADDEFVATIKYDGSSMTVYSQYNEENEETYVGVCSRNWEMTDEDNNTYWKVAYDIGLVDALRKMGMNIAFQGELVGPGIQGNPYKYDKQHFIIFNIWDIDGKRYLNYTERHELITAINLTFKLNLENAYTLHYRVDGVSSREMLEQVLADIGRVNDQEIEGIVFKSINHPERSYKYINPNYLLKDKD